MAAPNRADRIECHKCKKYLTEYGDKSWLTWFMRCGGKQQKLIDDILDHCEVCDDVNGLDAGEIVAYTEVMNLPDSEKAKAKYYVEQVSAAKRAKRHQDSVNRKVRDDEERKQRRVESLNRKHRFEAEQKDRHIQSTTRKEEKEKREGYGKHRKACTEAMARLKDGFYDNPELENAKLLQTLVKDITNCQFMAIETGNQKYTDAAAELKQIERELENANGKIIQERRAELQRMSKECEKATERIKHGYYDVLKQTKPAAEVRKTLVNDTIACKFVQQHTADDAKHNKLVEALDKAREDFKFYKSPVKREKTKSVKPKSPSKGGGVAGAILDKISKQRAQDNAAKKKKWWLF